MIIKKETTFNTYLNHARQNQMIRKNKRLDELNELPVCPKCERLGLRHKGWKKHKIMVCPHCGYEGKTSLVMGDYIKQGLFK